ncbi:hypothetical protein QJS66_18080 [Kocuria rhizophila]|nr:hypothetical protein QJS66_18080 [Kocuria rhizophila]
MPREVTAWRTLRWRPATRRPRRAGEPPCPGPRAARVRARGEPGAVRGPAGAAAALGPDRARGSLGVLSAVSPIATGHVPRVHAGDGAVVWHAREPGPARLTAYMVGMAAGQFLSGRFWTWWGATG